jgi:hypothetical protein
LICEAGHSKEAPFFFFTPFFSPFILKLLYERFNLFKFVNENASIIRINQKTLYLPKEKTNIFEIGPNNNKMNSYKAGLEFLEERGNRYPKTIS